MSIQDLISQSLAQKYAIMQQQADTQRQQVTGQQVGINAAANLDKIRAGLMPAESAANIANTNANTRLTGLNADWLPKLNAANIRATDAGIGETRARTGLIGSQTEQINQLLQMFRLGSASPAGGLRGAGLGSVGGLRDLDMRSIRGGYE